MEERGSTVASLPEARCWCDYCDGLRCCFIFFISYVCIIDDDDEPDNNGDASGHGRWEIESERERGSRSAGGRSLIWQITTMANDNGQMRQAAPASLPAPAYLSTNVILAAGVAPALYPPCHASCHMPFT